jgi:hypothetical protein
MSNLFGEDNEKKLTKNALLHIAVHMWYSGTHM